MEAISRLPRRLTQLYSDTKTTCDAVVEQDNKDTPESHALHRKFRIQKDRLITWGVDWSDNSKGKHGDIDDSVEEAGMTETVTSVLRTIKEILDEADRMHSGAPAAGVGKTLSGEKSRPDPPSWAAADRSRYEDLIKDLTTSIDTLYDISRNRRIQRGHERAISPGKAVPQPLQHSTSNPVFLSVDYNASDLTLVNPATFSSNTQTSRPNLPPKLQHADIVLPDEEPPPYESVGTTSDRVIGRLRSRPSSNPWRPDGCRNNEIPVLVDYASYDPAYRVTGVSPSTERLEALLSILSKLSNGHLFHGTLKCLGYFEDPKHPRFGLVFELPNSVYSGPADSQKPAEELKPVTLLSVLQTGSKSLHNSNSATPPLEDRFRLAFTLAVTFSKIHGDNFAHKDVNSTNIVLFKKNKRQSANSRALQYSLRTPVVCSFDLFSDCDIDATKTMPTLNIYRHPEDPKFTGAKDHYTANFDLYGLGLVLLEVGLWQPLSDLWKQKYTLSDFKQRIEDVYIRRLASKCGTAYMQVVRDCFSAADAKSDDLDMYQVYSRILTRLQRCCMLDESEPGFDLGNLRPDATPVQQAPTLKRKGASQPQLGSDIQHSPSYRSAKRWALEKGSQALERTKSLSKKSPDLALARNPSRSSQHSIRKSISESLRMMSPKQEATEMEWEQRDPLEESGTLVDTPSNSQDLSDTSSLCRERVITAASTIQRAWRQSRNPPNKHATLRDYKEKITIIQKAWRQTKQKRTSSTVSALVTDGLRHWPQATLGYPTPEPEIQTRTVNPSESCITSSIQIETDMEPVARPKLRLFPVKFTPEIVDEWHSSMLPRLERLIERALKDSEETVSIDLVAIGEILEKAKPTVFVTCSSVAKVRAILGRRFRYDENVYDLKVRRGKIRRSKMSRSSRRTRPPHRSMMNTDSHGADMAVMNPYHQQRPLCGASIGAFNGQHLPPVSYGGVILVDDEPLGMSVHHLLDAPSDDESDTGEEFESPYTNDVTLSSASNNPWLMGMGAQPGLHLDSEEPAPMWDLELSDDEDLRSEEEDADADSFDFSDSEFGSDDESAQDMAESVMSRATMGDIDGICPGEGEEIKITQPAIDDVDPDFFPDEEDRDDDHLTSHELGHVHASSGIRRWKRDGILHEIDWALLKLKDDRLQPYNICQGGRRFCIGNMTPEQRAIASKLTTPVDRRQYRPEEDEYPNGVAPASSLGGLNVHCFGRTTGLQGGMISSVMSAVRIYHRKSFSRSWHVAGDFGIGGDSGAWVVQNGKHKVVGHVLAFCHKNKIAYICPMEVLLEDIKRTLGAKRIYLPGSVEQTLYAAKRARRTDGVVDLGERVQGLGIVDSAVDVREALGSGPPGWRSEYASYDAE
ncbi:ATP binding protein [Stemphylium lycopersici]|uniref:ATP binding protein n=1 Tax=Stemphylium lycopersici TaxID=183478 RepID=A0A364N327_STELY|nr:ATP binding protein [Stemphylium lycopersici]